MHEEDPSRLGAKFALASQYPRIVFGYQAKIGFIEEDAEWAALGVAEPSGFRRPTNPPPQ